MPTISIVIPTYARPEMLLDALLSVQAQTFTDFEAIVVDDNVDVADKEKTRSVVSYIADTRFTLIDNVRTKGGCGARNTGIHAAKAEYVAFLDDDDVYLPDALISNLNAMTPEAVMVFGGFIHKDNNYDCSQEVTYMAEKCYSFDDLIHGFCPSTASVVMVRRTALLESGNFSENLLSFQDYDAWLQISRLGHVVSNPCIVARFIQHSGKRTSTDFEKRMISLDIITKKWKSEIEQNWNVDAFRNHFIKQLYLDYAVLLLSMGLVCRIESIMYFAKRLIIGPNRIKDWLWFISSIAGFRITKWLRKRKSHAYL